MAKKIGSVVITDAKLEEAMKGKAEGATYTGAGDNLLNLGSAKSFVNEDESGKRFSVVLDNTDASATDTVVRFNDIIDNPSGTVLLEDGTITGTHLNASGTPNKIDVLAEYVKHHPTRLRSIKFSADDASLLDEPIRLIKKDPFAKNPVEVERTPSDYQSQNTQNPKMVDVDDFEGWMLSSLSTMTYKVPAGHKITLTMVFGASIDIDCALEKKAEDAALTVAQAYVANN